MQSQQDSTAQHSPNAEPAGQDSTAQPHCRANRMAQHNMGSFVTLSIHSLRSLLESCHNCAKGNPAQVCIVNTLPERLDQRTVQPFTFSCCETVISAEGAIFWHSEDITPDVITDRTQPCHELVQISQDLVEEGKELNDFVDISVKFEDDSAKSVVDDDVASCKVVLEKDPLLLDELSQGKANRVDCECVTDLEGCETKSSNKALRKRFVGILGQQDLLGANITGELNRFAQCTKGRKYPEIFTCEFCGKTFQGKERAYQFYYHRNREHTRETAFKCDVCSKEFWGDRELFAHRSQHKDEGHICHACGRRFNAKKNLKVHLLTHNSTREHVCRYCDKTFRRKDHLVVHERVHTGIRPYQCQWCDSGYPQKHQLKLHIRKCPILRQAEAKLCAS